MIRENPLHGAGCHREPPDIRDQARELAREEDAPRDSGAGRHHGAARERGFGAPLAARERTSAAITVGSLSRLVPQNGREIGALSALGPSMEREITDL